jgi:Leucine-rich repeat (LRR) protein
MKKTALYLIICMCLILTSAHAGLAQAQAPIPEEQTRPHFPQDLLENDDEPWLRHLDVEPQEEREFIPPTEESLKRTQEQVQAFDCGTVTDVLRTECEALVALYENTNGTAWKDNTNWLTTTTVGNWKGVTVESSHVIEIVLLSNKLSGTIPSELGQLSKLVYLILNNNHLTGTIPSVLGQLSKLEFLYLHNNQLTGTIPSEIGQLSNLAGLILADNQLSGTIPSKLGQLTQLIYLDINHNQLWGSMPSEIGNLTKLLHFDISHNYISGNVPASFANLVNLCVEGDLDEPCDGDLKTDLGYNLLNVLQPDPPSAFMYEKDPDWDQTQVGRLYFNYMPIIATK